MSCLSPWHMPRCNDCGSESGGAKGAAPKATLNSHYHYENCEGCEAIREIARAEGKAEGLEAAARLADSEAEECLKSSKWCDINGHRTGGLIDAAGGMTSSRIATRIRSLIPAAPEGR